MNIKLIACDMDGTLLDDKKKISSRTAKAIAAAMEAGIMFVIATGRMYISAKPYAEQLGLDVPIVTYNGALIRGSRSGKIFYEQPIKKETAQRVLDYCKEHHYYLQFYVGDACYIKEANAYSDYYERIQTIKLNPVGDNLYSAIGEPYKILITSEPEEHDAIMEGFKEHFSEVLHITSSHPQFVELLDPAVNKWATIQKLAAQYNIQPEEIMCLGDSGNDLEMVANAGLGVAVGNAVPEVKHSAKIITASNNEDGVAMAIEYVLNNLVQNKLSTNDLLADKLVFTDNFNLSIENHITMEDNTDKNAKTAAKE